MKKIMIAAAIVCAAAFAQAATVNWTISNVKNPEGGAPTSGWAVMAFYTDAGTGSEAIENAIKGGTAGSLSIDSSKTLSVSMSKGKVAAHDVDVAALTDTSKNYDFYFVVFNNVDAASADKYVMVSSLDQEYSGLAGKFVPSANFTGATWQDMGSAPIPEPTSGLLLVLGMAGLALRRRHA